MHKNEIIHENLWTWINASLSLTQQQKEDIKQIHTNRQDLGI